MLIVICELDFGGFFFGFRPKRSPAPAMDALNAGITIRQVSRILDTDIRGHFNAIACEWLQKFIGNRRADQRVLRHIEK